MAWYDPTTWDAEDVVNVATGGTYGAGKALIEGDPVGAVTGSGLGGAVGNAGGSTNFDIDADGAKDAIFGINDFRATPYDPNAVNAATSPFTSALQTAAGATPEQPYLDQMTAELPGQAASEAALSGTQLNEASRSLGQQQGLTEQQLAIAAGLDPGRAVGQLEGVAGQNLATAARQSSGLEASGRAAAAQAGQDARALSSVGSNVYGDALARAHGLESVADTNAALAKRQAGGIEQVAGGFGDAVQGDVGGIQGLERELSGAPSAAEAAGRAAMNRSSAEAMARAAGARGANSQLMQREAMAADEAGRRQLVQEIAAQAVAEQNSRFGQRADMLGQAAGVRATGAQTQGSLLAQAAGVTGQSAQTQAAGHAAAAGTAAQGATTYTNALGQAAGINAQGQGANINAQGQAAGVMGNAAATSGNLYGQGGNLAQTGASTQAGIVGAAGAGARDASAGFTTAVGNVQEAGRRGVETRAGVAGQAAQTAIAGQGQRTSAASAGGNLALGGQQVIAGSHDAANAANANITNANAANTQASTSGLLASVFSDMRAKEDVRKIEPWRPGADTALTPEWFAEREPPPETASMRAARQASIEAGQRAEKAAAAQAIGEQRFKEREAARKEKIQEAYGNASHPGFAGGEAIGGFFKDILSDRDSKEEIRSLRSLLEMATSPEANRENLEPLEGYSFRYKPAIAAAIGEDTEPRDGIMADDLEDAPAGRDAVFEAPVAGHGDMKALDQNRALSFALAAAAGLDDRVKALEGGRQRRAA